jgi:hypothetical protein
MESEFNLPVKQIAKRMSLDERLANVGFPVGSTPRQVKAITKARIDYAFSQFVEGNVALVEQWLREVGDTNPAEGVRLFMEFTEFYMPRLKPMQVNVNVGAELPGNGRELKDMSIEELQSVVAEQG